MAQDIPILRQRRIARVATGGLVVLALLAAAISQLAQSENTIQWVAAKLVTASGGRLSITGARGSLVGKMAIDRVTFKSTSAEVVASDVRFDWQPSGLLFRQIGITTLAAGDFDVTLLHPPANARSTGSFLPDSLGLPIAVRLEHLSVDRLTLHSGDSRSIFTSIHGSFAGDATRHTLSNIAFQSEFGTIGGELKLAAAKPFELAGVLDWSLGEGAARTFARAVLGGTLERIDGQLSGGYSDLALTGTAIVVPLADSWLPELTLIARDVDLTSVFAKLPKTGLSGRLTAGTDDRGQIAGKLDLVNAIPGRWTDQRLPMTSLVTQIKVDNGVFRFDQLQASLGPGGRISGSGNITGSGTALNITLADVDLRAIHKPLRATRLNGHIKATLAAGRQNFDAMLEERRLKLAVRGTIEGGRSTLHALTAKAGKGELEATGELSLTGLQAFSGNANFARFDPSEFGEFPPASISGTTDMRGQLLPEWWADARFALKESSFRGAPLSGSAAFKISARTLREASVDLQVGANHLRGQGGLGAASDTLELTFDGRRLAQLDPLLSGTLVTSVKLSGTMMRPQLSFEAKGDALAFGPRFTGGMLEARGSWSSDDDPHIELSLKGSKLALGAVKFDTLTVTTAGALALHTITLGVTAPGIEFASKLEGGIHTMSTAAGSTDHRWTGLIRSSSNRGSLPFELRSPVSLEASPFHVVLGETTADFLGGRLLMQSLRWENGRLSSVGGFTGVPVAPLLSLAGVTPEPSSDLTLRGAWAIQTSPRLNGTLTVTRESGDLVVLEDSKSRIGFERMGLEMKFVEDTVRAELAVQATQLGTAKVDVTVLPLARGGPFAPQSTLSGNAQLDVANLHLLDNWIGTAALVDGALRAQLGLAGTLAQPLLTGTLEGERIRFEIPQQGIALKNGRLRAELTDRALILQEFSIAGPAGKFDATGTLARRDSDSESQIDWRATDLQLLDRPDQRLTVAGSGTVGVSKNRVQVQGSLKALKGNIEFERPHTTPLGDDVVIVGRKAKPETTSRRSTPLDLDASLDFGEHFKLTGAGLETGLQGKLRVHTSADGTLLAAGKLRAVNGSYFAFGQKLTIERGQLYFDGPLANPGLEILAVRKNLPVEAGVEVTGTVRAPRVQLTSNPPVPDGEKLSWLVTGRGLDSASATDFGLLQAAAGSLINSSQSIPQTHLIARKIGLDDIGVRASGTGASTGATGGEALAIGKNLSDKIYLEYEKGLDVAGNVLRLNYQLSRAFSLRVESGADSAVGVFYRRSYD